MKYEYRDRNLQGVVRKVLGKHTDSPAVERKFAAASGSIGAPAGRYGSGDTIDFDNLCPQNVVIYHSCDGSLSAGYFVDVSVNGRSEKDWAECPGSGSFSIFLPKGRGYITIQAQVSRQYAPLAEGGTVRFSIR